MGECRFKSKQAREQERKWKERKRFERDDRVTGNENTLDCVWEVEGGIRTHLWFDFCACARPLPSPLRTRDPTRFGGKPITAHARPHTQWKGKS